MKSIRVEEKYHDEVAESFSDVRKHDFIWEIPEQLYLLKNIYFKNKVVVDVGCGPAISVKKNIDKKILKQCTYIGIDISKKMLSLAKINIPEGKFYHSDISNLPLNKKTADTILSLGALHHVENQLESIKNWMDILKIKGYLLLREPIYEALKRGEGASPIEEGIKTDLILKTLEDNGFILHKKIFFSSKFFHIMNKIFIKTLGDFWKNSKILWYPVMILDIFFTKIFGDNIPFFKGEACIIIAQKV